MSRVMTSVDVDVAVRTAYNQWTQFASFPQFLSGVESVSQLDAIHTHWVVRVGGVRRQFDAEVSEQIPDEVIAWASTSEDIGGHNGRITFEALGPTSTRVSIDLGWEPVGVLEKTGDLLGLDHRQVDRSAQEFKRFIEGLGTETGAWRGEVLDRHSPTRDASIPGAWATDDGYARDPAKDY